MTVDSWESPFQNDTELMCPCPINARRLEDPQEGKRGETWQIVYMCIVLLYMFIALLSDRVGADAVMITALTLCMAAEIITIKEGLEGFANEGLLTVMVLFVVAEGISVTGALDWYMGKLLGSPSTTAGAQLRLMVPVAAVSAFMNNTPVVAVMIPIVQQWSKKIRQSPQQLLIPLSFASILGGTCTLIGTSTNLVVVGLLNDRFPNDDTVSIGLFDLSIYGVPVAIAGIAYTLLLSPFLLPGGKRRSSASDGIVPLDGNEILMGARLTQWSPAAGRSVKRSGLRDTGGVFLVSVYRSATGNVHRAVGQEFVLNVGDILYFTGLVEGFGDFCEEHGLEVVTNEVEDTMSATPPTVLEHDEHSHDTVEGGATNERVQFEDQTAGAAASTPVPKLLEHEPLAAVAENECEDAGDVPCEVGITKKSLIQADEAEKMRSINRMTDMIRGRQRDEPVDEAHLGAIRPISRRKRQQSVGLNGSDPPKIVVTTDHLDTQGLVLVGVNARDRPGLLLDISKGLLRLNLQLRHTEAAVVGERSVSIWRCECLDGNLLDLEEVWSVMNSLLENESGVQAVKTRGLKVIRAVVTKNSRLIGSTAAEMNFRETYKAAIVAVQKDGKNTVKALSQVRFSAGDILVLQASEDSPLLTRPPDGFYKRSTVESSSSNAPSRSNSVSSLVKMVTKRFNASELKDEADSGSGEREQTDNSFVEDMESGFYVGESDETGNGADGRSIENAEVVAGAVEDETLVELERMEAVWRDLRVPFKEENESSSSDLGAREFLTAMEVVPNSQLAKKTAAQAGISQLPGVFLVSIERPVARPENEQRTKVQVLSASEMSAASSVEGTLPTVEPTFVAVDPDEPLMAGDVLWFAGSASSVGDLRKIPGLKSYQSEEVDKIEDKVYDRRLVQAVIARKGPLVGKTVKEARFRTRYGAAVIAVHREGSRIHDHPGRIKLQGGDVLLLEAGPTFLQRSRDQDRSFALLAEVEDSAPPRLRYLIPAVGLAIAMLVVYAAGVASLLICGLVAAILMVILGIMSEQEARNAVNWEIYVTIASAFGIGTALTNSGVANAVAQFLTNVGKAIGIGDAGLLGAVYLATFLISNVVTNNAAAALIFPIAIDAAEKTGTDLTLMSYCVMLGASASFMSPFGYTTNLMIYGPGGYKYKDFLFIGTPMQVVLWILSVVFLITSDQWYICWIITILALVVVAAFRLTNGAVTERIFSKKSAQVTEEPGQSAAGHSHAS